MEQLQPINRHIYNIKWQFVELKLLKENLKTDEVIIQEDLSRNFQLKHQNEVMTAHWSCDKATLFTAMKVKKVNLGMHHMTLFVMKGIMKSTVSIRSTQPISMRLSRLTQVSKILNWSEDVGSQIKTSTP